MEKERSPVFVMHDKFKEVLKKREFADDMLVALVSHPRFRETGDGIFQIHEAQLSAEKALTEFVTAARQKYPMCHMAWNKREFDKYDSNLTQIEMGDTK